MKKIQITCAGIASAVLFLGNASWTLAQNKKSNVPIISNNLMASKINESQINLFSINCKGANYGDEKIFCTSFNINIEDKLSENEKRGEQLRAAIKEIREGAADLFCKEKEMESFERFISIFDEVKSGKEIRISGKLITKKTLEDHVAAMKNEPMFRELDGVDFFQLMRNIRSLCANNAAEIRRIFEASIIRGFENQKKTAKVDFFPSRTQQEYVKDFETGYYYFERTTKNECFRYYQRDEIRFNKDMIKFGMTAWISEYEENVRVLDMLQSDSKCLDRAKGYSKKIIWRAGQSFNWPAHWKFFELSKF